MKLIVDIPNGLYTSLEKIKNGSIASKRVLDCVCEGKPLDKMIEEIEAYNSPLIGKNVVLDKINKYCMENANGKVD